MNKYILNYLQHLQVHWFTDTPGNNMVKRLAECYSIAESLLPGHEESTYITLSADIHASTDTSQ